MDNLFQPYKLNDTLTLDNRIVMAPLTRCMADDDLVPTQAMADYYGRRADAGLIISEAVLISADGQGYPNTPGLFAQKQVEGWRKVTAQVHKKGAKIFAQLWHTGRVAHPAFFGGDKVMAPSAVGIEGSVPRMRHLNYVVPTPMSHQEITRVVNDFKQAAINAIDAGFDGVEIHGANGYLIDQFLHHHTNRRTDEYGESPENMSRFALEVVEAITDGIGADRTGLRLSPAAYFNIDSSVKDRDVFDYLLAELNHKNLAYLHVGIFDDSQSFEHLGGTASEYMRKQYHHTLMGVGGFTAATGSQAIKEKKFDLLAIGRPFIANPDYVNLVRSNEAVKEYDESMLAELV